LERQLAQAIDHELGRGGHDKVMGLKVSQISIEKFNGSVGGTGIVFEIEIKAAECESKSQNIGVLGNESHRTWPQGPIHRQNASARHSDIGDYCQIVSDRASFRSIIATYKYSNSEGANEPQSA
jgi:hypothetical protein